MTNTAPQQDMITVTFPDGNARDYTTGTTGFDIAESISKSLSKAAIAITFNGQQKDLCDPLNENGDIGIITIKDDAGLEIMRHTLTAQVLARAVKNLYPSAKLAIGPTIENGFYYDVAFEKEISSDDLGAIEKEMRRILGAGNKITKKILSKAEAQKLFAECNEPYKVDIIERTEGDAFQIYTQEETDFIDLCVGP
ncbi:MAG: TGS domain-containing protein, partial [Alphaproteobacteria bacterium]|nr:TGS domain-containing protein [Alphaproteobacteria bacterium]